MDNWGEGIKLVASNAQLDDRLGFSVAVSGETAVVGAAGEESAGKFSGAAYVFQRDEGGADNWGEVTKLTASNAGNGHLFGWSVSVSGDNAIVGAIGEDTWGSFAGAAYGFQQDAGGTDNWGQVKKLVGYDTQAFDNFGFSASVSAEVVFKGDAKSL